MTIEEELKQAVETRNAKRKAKAEELPNRINEFMGGVLPIAIAQDEPAISVTFNRADVSKTLWNGLIDYSIENAQGDYRKNLIDLIVEDVYKPYLVGYIMDVGYLNMAVSTIRITFYINQV